MTTLEAARQMRPVELARQLGQLLRRGEVALALGMVAILVVLVIPLPRWLLDVSLALSLSLSVVTLMTTLFITRALDFNTFPTVLLITTMLRLSLNLASARLILSHGHEGTDAAGHVIEAFGGMLMQGNFVIGLIIYAILAIINFIVITKGSGRIAEVSARFALDAMPGKQMAVDADLSAGLIAEDEARRRRRELEEESTFFGAMDGAAKFVRGDAVAGLIITLINIVGGILIGVLQHDLSFADATRTFTVLTVGDGLVTQIPAFIISTAAGLIVTKSGAVGTADKALFQQVGGPLALALAAGLMALLALLPGIPALPFLAIASALAWFAHRVQAGRARAASAADIAIGGEPGAAADEPIATALRVDLLRLELGYGLLTLVNSPKGQRLTDQIKALRRQLASELGFVMPAVRIQDNLQLPANAYVVRIKEIEAGRGDLRPNMLMVIDPRGGPIALPGEMTREPTFGLPAMWVAESHREEAQFRGYTVVDPATVITTHVTELVKDHLAELLSYAETQKLLNELDKDVQKLLADIVPAQITIGGLQRVLHNLLNERVSIRDLAGILEGVAEACQATRTVAGVTEHVRTRLARQISEAHVGESGFIPVVTLSPEWERTFAESLVGEGDERQLSIAPSQLQSFIAQTRRIFDGFNAGGDAPALLTSPVIRPFVRSIVERFRPLTAVLSQAEIHPRARIKAVGEI